MASPTSRTLEEAEKLGFTATVVERRVPFRNTTLDAFGCGDILACRPGVGILLIQATSRSNHAARRKKAAAIPALRDWLESGGRFEIWSWGKMKKRVNRRLWQVWREELRLGDLTSTIEEAA